MASTCLRYLAINTVLSAIDAAHTTNDASKDRIRRAEFQIQSSGVIIQMLAILFHVD